MNVDDLLARLEAVKPEGDSEWNARCPAHEDRRASLSVGVGRDGRIVLHCHAGCELHEILDALKLELADIGPPKAPKRRRTNGSKTTKPTKTNASIVTTYDYHDAKGRFVYQIVRKSDKSFLQRRRARDGEWIWSMQGIARVPYRLPQLLSSEGPVFIVEGEKDVETLERLKLTATTAAGGANARWPQSWAKYFEGRDVVILPDNDEAGRKYAKSAVRTVSEAAKSIRVLELPGLGPKGDVSDWVASGGTKKKLLELAAAAKVCNERWRHGLLVTQEGKVRSVLPNAVLLMRHLDACQGRLCWDSRYLRAEWTDKGPAWNEGDGPRPVRDADAVEASRWLAGVERVAFGADLLWTVIVAEAQRHQVDRIASYLKSLTWDKRPRIDTWLIDLLGATPVETQEEPGEDLEDEWLEYVKAVGSKWLISAVARSLSPGCQADHMLILEGEQGTLKSSSLAALGGEHYAELSLDVESKDAVMSIHGPWIVEWSELAGLGRREAEAVKAFISRRSDRFRPPYGRHVEDCPRSCVFAGTTNERLPLTDGTGNRRYWPVHVRRANPDAVGAVRDQLWAEAVHRYRAGECWWLTPELEHIARIQQEDRLEHDTWEDSVSEILEDGTLKLRDFVTTAAIFDELMIPTSQRTTAAQRRLARIMDRLGWATGRQRIGASRPRGYNRPGRLFEMDQMGVK